MHIPKTHREIQPGVLQRIHPASPTSTAIASSYAARALSILNSDLPHYDKLYPILAPYISSLPLCSEIMAWGGGHPKLESHILHENPAKFQFPSITVIDAAAEMYQRLHPDFEKLYGPTPVIYLPVENIDPFLVATTHSSDPRATHALHTYVHFLEHADSWDTVQSYIQNTFPAPILIYGPNIDVAQSGHWFHFRPADHNVFWHPAIMDQLLRTLYKNVYTLTHSDDLFHIAW